MEKLHAITKLIKGNKVYEKMEEISELMNESFWSVFNIDDFIEPNDVETHEGLQNIVMNKCEISRILEKMDVREAKGPYRVSGWTQRMQRTISRLNFGCDQQLINRKESTKRVEGRE